MRIVYIYWVFMFASGMAIGLQTRSTAPAIVEKTATPPVEASVAEVVVGSLKNASAAITLPVVVVKTRSSAPPKIDERHTSHFFDFEHAQCDEAESVRGKVIRCGRR
jgi:hypothetical protein